MQMFPSQRRRIVLSALSVVLLFSVVIMSSLLLVRSQSAKADSGAGVTVNWNETHQSIDGFGVADPWPADFLQSFAEPARSEMVSLLFSQDRGAGFSILRSEIGSGGGAPANTNTQTIEPSQGNFTWNVDAGQVWLMHQAQSYGVNQFESTAWSPPAWMKTNNSVTNGGSLRTDMYQAYADYLAAYVQGYHSHFGVDTSAISPANEPDVTQTYQSANWTGEQFRTFVRDYLKPTFVKDGITTKILLPEPSCWNDVLGGKNFAGPTLSDPQAAAGVDIVAGHDYCNNANTPFTQAKQLGKQQWETEVSNFGSPPANPWISDGLQWANRIYTNLVQAESNAWFFWLATHPASLNNADNQALLYQDSSNNTFSITKRLFAIGNYSRFIRPGYVRIGATSNPTSNVNLSAYKDPGNSKVVIVAVNNDTSNSQNLNISVNGFSPTYLTPYVTSALESLEQNTSVPFSNGSAAVTLPPASITTFVGSTGSVPTSVEDPLIDLSKTYSHSANLGIDQSNWASFYGDSSRLYHTTNTDENIVYRVSGGSTATVKDYYNKDAAGNGVVFKVSSDGTNFTTVTPTADTPKPLNGGDWFEINYTISIPANASYLQIEIPPNPYAAWTPEIAHVTLGAVPQGSGGGATPTPTATATPTPGNGGVLNRSGWTATASRSYTGQPPSFALDGNASTSWTTGGPQQSGDYFQVDMQSTQQFSKIVLDTTGSENDYPRGYAVYVSNDGNNWGSAIASGSGSSPVTTITFATQSARYIKVVLTAGDGLWWWSIHEFTVYS